MAINGLLTAVSPNRRSSINLSNAISQIRSKRDPVSVSVADSLGQLQQWADSIEKSLRQDAPTIQKLLIEAPDGALLSEIGSFERDGITQEGFYLTLNGTETVIANLTINGIDKVGLLVNDTANGNQSIVTPDAVFLLDSTLKIAASMALNGAAGILKAFDGSNAGGIDGHGLRAVMDGSNGNITGTGGVFADSLNTNNVLVVDNAQNGKFSNVFTSGVKVIDSAQNGSFNDISAGGTQVIDASRNATFVNCDAASYSVGGVPGSTGSFTAITSFTTALIQYKDWSGTNQSVTVVDSIAATAIGFTNGIKTT